MKFSSPIRVFAIFAALVYAAAAPGPELGIVVARSTPAEAVLNVVLTGGAGALTGLQFRIDCDSAPAKIGVAVGPSAGNAGKSLQSAAAGPASQRVLIIGLNQTGIADGVVAVVRVSPSPVSGDGKPHVRLSGLAGTNLRGEAIVIRLEQPQ